MSKYQNGKLYMLKSNETEEVYIGSTYTDLKKRFGAHKSAFKCGNPRQMATAKKILKYADARIELIENFPCETKKELLDREGEIIRNTPNCVNTQIQGRTIEQYRVDYAVKLKQQSKDYYETHKEALKIKHQVWRKGEAGQSYQKLVNIKRNVKVICPTCSNEVSKSNIKRHMKTHVN